MYYNDNNKYLNGLLGVGGQVLGDEKENSAGAVSQDIIQF